MQLLSVILGLLAASAYADIKTQPMDYAVGGVAMESFVAFDDSTAAKKPLVLIVHDWMGLGDFAKSKATELAKMGYVAVAVDAYGKGVRPKNQEEAAKMAGGLKNDRDQLRSRMRGAMDQALKLNQVNREKVVVMGYCFGGTSALELARSGAPLVGTVTFHGGLANPRPEDAKNIHGKALILHGADDPHVPPAEVQSFRQEMDSAKVPYRFIAYPGAVHSFAVPSAGSDKSKGNAYDPDADRKSWAEFTKFLKEVTK